MSVRRDPAGRRRAIVEAACALIAEDGAAALTHRRVAARAGVPLGATTYYFTSLGDLSRAALQHAAEVCAQLLRVWDGRLREGGDPAATLTALCGEYLADRPRALLKTELYTAAARRPELRQAAALWSDGLAGLLAVHAGPDAARAAVFLVDGALLNALTTGRPLDAPAVEAALRALLSPAG